MTSRARAGAAGAALLVAAALVLLFGAPDRRAGALVVLVELQVPGGNAAQLFWAADQAFTQEASVTVPLSPGGATQRLRFLVPTGDVRWLRFDPTDASGEIRILRIQVLDAQGRIADVAPDSIRPLYQISAFEAGADGIRLTTAASANDPSLLIPLGCVGETPLRSRLATFTSTALVLTTLAALSLAGLAAWVVGAAAFRRDRRVEHTGTTGSRISGAVWIGALCLAIVSAKLLLMRTVPVYTPFWDQWDSEAAALFIPYSACSLTWHTMFAFHNEHRIFFTRLLALDLLAINGQWDPRLEQVVNGCIHGGTGALLALMLWIAGERRRIDLIVVLVALAFALPFSWENTLVGFQSAFYFLLLFSLLAMWLTTTHPVGTLPWYVGWACALCALFTAASGLVAAVAIGGMTVLQLASGRLRGRHAAVNVAVAVAVFAVGLAVASPPLAHHAVYRVASARDFIIALARSLAWPHIFQPGAAVAAWLPLAVLATIALWRRLRTTPLEQFTLGIGTWVAMHAVALAYARGVGGAPPAGRYMDFLSLGFVANAMALVAILDRVRLQSAARKAAIAATTGWLIFAVVGLNGLARQATIDLDAWTQYYAAHTEHVRRYVMTGDAAALRSKAPMTELPYPVPDRLLQLLQDPYIRRILPAAVRAPIDLEPRTISGEAFARGAAHQTAPADPLVETWGSFTNRGNEAQGRFESEPIACVLERRLRFDVAGHLGFDAHSLAVADRDGRAVQVTRSRAVRDGWSHAYVGCPDGPLAVVARDESRWSWFAFRPPVEIGTWSVLAERLIASAWGLLLTGLILLALAARWG